MSTNEQIQPEFLNSLRKERVQVAVFLVSGIKLVGYIESFDQYVVLLKSTVSQMVYKQAISTIIPARAVLKPNVDSKSTPKQNTRHPFNSLISRKNIPVE